MPQTNNVSSDVAPSRGALKRPGEHLFWLDWLRFGAAFIVVMCHARGSNWVPWGQLEQSHQTRVSAMCFAVTRPGLEAVVVFFALSGFLVGGRLIERWRDSRLDLKRYWIDRVARIYTPLLPALVFTAAVSPVRGLHWSWLDFGCNLLGLQGLTCGSFAGNAPLWSLAYEIWFYVLAGCAIAIASGARCFRMTAWILLGVGFAIFTKLSAVYLSCWVIGAIAYLCCGKQMGWRLTTAAVSFVIIGVTLSQLTSGTKSLALEAVKSWIPSRDVAIMVLSVGIAMLLPVLSSQRPGLRFVSLEQWGSRLAAFSYTLYLVHYPLIDVITRISGGPFATIDYASQCWFYAKIAASLVFAWLIYLPFEAQTPRIRGWLTRAL